MMRRPLALVLTAFLVVLASIPVLGASAATGSPRYVERLVIGHTVQGRPIVAWRIGNPQSKRKVVLMAAIHGDETGPSRILLNLRDGKKISGADIWVIPRFNADGVAHHTRTNAHGVNLNRNFPVQWVPLTGSSDSGPRPASEPETRALMSFMEKIRPMYVVSFHQPLHGVGTDAKGRPFQRRLSRGLHLPRQAFNCDGVCHGTFTEWFNRNFRGVAITVEYGTHLSRSQARRSGPAGLLAAIGAHR